MDQHRQSHKDHPSNRGFQWSLTGFLLVAGYFLILEQRAHPGGVLNYLPLLPLLACPSMHLFMQHGHRRHGNHSMPKTTMRSANDPGGPTGIGPVDAGNH